MHNIVSYISQPANQLEGNSLLKVQTQYAHVLFVNSNYATFIMLDNNSELLIGI